MRNTPVVLIEFHWLSPPSAPRRKTAAVTRNNASSRGYQLPGRNWLALLDGIACHLRGAPIVFFRYLEEAPDDPPEPSAIWHRVH